MTAWIVEHLGPDVPLHFTAFHPDYRMLDVPPTPPATLTPRARDRAAQRRALRLHRQRPRHRRRQHDVPLVPRRRWSSATGTTSARTGSTATGAAASCGTPMPGRYDGPPGEFGRRRIPVRLAEAGAP